MFEKVCYYNNKITPPSSQGRTLNFIKMSVSNSSIILHLRRNGKWGQAEYENLCSLIRGNKKQMNEIW